MTEERVPTWKRPRPELTPEQKAELSDWVTELHEVQESRGRHEGHTLRQAGRCVYCSCGYRYQGSLS